MFCFLVRAILVTVFLFASCVVAVVMRLVMNVMLIHVRHLRT